MALISKRRQFKPLPGGGGGGTSALSGNIDFKILDVGQEIGKNATACDVVKAEVVNRSHTAPSKIGDIVYIWDPDFCNFHIPPNLLIGKMGVAMTVENPWALAVQEYIDTRNADVLSDCQKVFATENLPAGWIWRVIKLCCTEEYQVFNNPNI